MMNYEEFELTEDDKEFLESIVGGVDCQLPPTLFGGLNDEPQVDPTW